MDLQKQLEKVHSKQNAILIAEYVDDDPHRFMQLMKLFFHDEYRIAQRAAHSVSHCVDRHPELLKPHIKTMIKHLETNPKVAIRRNTVRVLQNQEIPEECQGLLVEKCFEYLTSAKETVAVKAFSMTILYHMTKIYPELKNEVIMVINDSLINATAGVKSRGKKIIALLEK
ncbi:MAG: hypothetical protein ABJF11_14380 [Reichenbachiella sp.]|uniref:hypothetical protein n=1 Tax=Reichenbachiella sp. TaxID=2184521 RepID=UPI003265BB1D